MIDKSNLFTADYAVVADISVMAICICCSIFLFQSYLRGSGRIRSIVCMMCLIFVSSVTNIQSHALINRADPVLIYLLRSTHNFCILAVLVLYIGYISVPLWLSAERKKRYLRLVSVLSLFTVLADFLLSLLKLGYYIDASGEVHKNPQRNLYAIMFVILTAIIFYLLIKHRNRLIKQVFRGLFGSILTTLLLMGLQGRHGQTSYTTLAYFFPVLGLIFFFHANPYDVDTGAVSDSFLYPELDSALDKNRPMYILNTYIAGFSSELAKSQDVHLEFNKFFRDSNVRGVLYRLPHDHLTLAFYANKKENPERTALQLIDAFKRSYSKFKLDFKVTVLKTSSDFTSAKDVINFLDHIEKELPINSVHYTTAEDIARYRSKADILRELNDIQSRGDLDDERVLVYCQPVYSLLTGKYDTAEALMRLRGEDGSLLYPDQFISIAEQHGQIHTLSMTILNKVCKQIHILLEAGYHIQRISVNFSAIDLRCDTFCDDVCRIIEANKIPYGKIAVEITESRSESDFSLVKQRVIDLQRRGIKFYLDDFGTGYSNFERIMEIPFDIIKFDRSMLIESNKSDSSEFMVCTFANMFNQLDYSVLFEGVENDSDEAHCMKMSASYLQGYKYSRPIPIEQLSHFLTFDNKVQEMLDEQKDIEPSG